MAAKAKTETFETVGAYTITRFFKGGAWSYMLIDANGTEIASTWSINKAADAWTTKGGPGPKFRAPVIGESAAVAWLRTVAA